MKKVITYGTYDLLHQGHINLLRRAKELGDYLIVGVTADGFDHNRGKINVQQSLVERIEAVKATGYADQIIVEEYEGQKIDDIQRYNIDIFTVGSDWAGKFDYLNEFCEVVYLDRTQGISSSEIRAKERALTMGMIGGTKYLRKFICESKYVNGLEVTSFCTLDSGIVKMDEVLSDDIKCYENYSEMLESVDAVYVISHPSLHYSRIKEALLKGKHVLCESPVTLSVPEFLELKHIAADNNCILMDAIRTAYATAYNRLLLLAKSGIIGKIYSVDCSCTQLKNRNTPKEDIGKIWNSLCTWGPNALLPIFQVFGVDYTHKYITSHIVDKETMYDSFTKIAFVFNKAVASIKVGKGVKSEGELVISGTEGYIYVPAPWWKTDYFEVRREDPAQNQRYFYQLDGEGIRYQLVSFLKSINTGHLSKYISREVSEAIIGVIQDFYSMTDTIII